MYILIHWWVEVLLADRSSIWTTAEPRVRLLLQCKTSLSPPVIYYWPFQGDLLLWLILIINVGSCSVCLWLTVQFSGHLLGKSCLLGFSLVLFYCSPLLNCRCPFPIWCLGQDVEFDCIGSWSLPFYLLYTKSFCSMDLFKKRSYIKLFWIWFC